MIIIRLKSSKNILFLPLFFATLTVMTKQTSEQEKPYLRIEDIFQLLFLAFSKRLKMP